MIVCTECGYPVGSMDRSSNGDIMFVGQQLVKMATQAVDKFEFKCRNPECENSK